MASSGSDVELSRFALSEAIRSLDHQEQELGRIRDRALTALGLLSASSAFLIGASVDHVARRTFWRFDLPLGVGTVCYLVVLALTLGLLKPTKWTAKISANVIIEDFGAGTIDDLNRLATFYDGAQDSNESALEDLRNRYKAVHLVAGLTLVVWITLVWASV